MSHAENTVGISSAQITHWSRNNPIVATAKVTAYFASLLVLGASVLAAEEVFVQAILVAALGVVFAHGLELQHEALHGNLFESEKLNRIIGFFLGAPMLVSFTHYRVQHLHHHKYVGTERDQELFNYAPQSLANPVSLIVRAWNFLRIPTFLVTALNILQNDYPELAKGKFRRHIWVEYFLLLSFLIAGLCGVVIFGIDHILLIWFLPWLVVAELVHFMIEVPEHIGCRRTAKSILKNTRSYPSNMMWEYVSNQNNYHIEHHLFPAVPAHRLRKIHPYIKKAQGHCTGSYFEALREIRQAVRDSNTGLQWRHDQAGG